jgi:hypothetical protein
MFTLPFGIEISEEQSMYTDLSLIEELHPLILDCSARLIETVQRLYNDPNKLYVNAVWLAKQVEGASIGLHGDNDKETYTHCKYTCGIYPKTLDKGGYVHFPNIGFTYSPRQGDLVIWPTLDSLYDHEIPEVIDDRYTFLFWLTEDKSKDLLESIK